MISNSSTVSIPGFVGAERPPTRLRLVRGGSVGARVGMCVGSQCRVGGAVGIAVVVVVVVVVVVCDGNWDEPTIMVVLFLLFFLCCFLRRFNFCLSSCRSSFRSAFFSGTLVLLLLVLCWSSCSSALSSFFTSGPGDVFLILLLSSSSLRPRSRWIGVVLFLDEFWSGYCCFLSVCTNSLLLVVVVVGCLSTVSRRLVVSDTDTCVFMIQHTASTTTRAIFLPCPLSDSILMKRTAFLQRLIINNPVVLCTAIVSKAIITTAMHQLETIKTTLL